MASECPDIPSCGSYFPGWLDGDPPTVTYGEIQMTVYFGKTNDCKDKSKYIRVKNCGAFTIYNLVKAPSCSHRYCGTD